MLIIDTHAHVFSPDETAYPAKPQPSRPPEGSGTPERHTDEVERHDVRAVTVVQVSGFYGFDNRYVRAVARQNPHWTAAICTLDPLDEAAPASLRKFATEGTMRGLRSVPAPANRLDHPGVRALWSAASDEGLPVNVQGNRGLEGQLGRLLREFPRLPIVLDHSLGLQAGPEHARTLETLQRLCVHRHLYAKLSFIANGEAGCADRYPCEDMHETVLRVVGLFGTERCAWGSHFPTERYGRPLTYGQHLEIYRSKLDLSDRDRRLILGETARRVWFPEMDRRL